MTDSDVPLLERFIAHLDAAGFSPGERVGSERGLAEEFGVSRSELRGALETLESGGRIRRTIGPSGGVFWPGGKVEPPLKTTQAVPDQSHQKGLLAITPSLSWGISRWSPV